MKKKILALCLVVVLAVTAVTGATLAYFTDTKEVENTFTVGKVEIKLDEAQVKFDDESGDYVVDKTKNRTEEGNAYTNIVPAQELPKDPTVTIVDGSEDCYVRMKVTVNYANLTTAFPKETEEEGRTAYPDYYHSEYGMFLLEKLVDWKKDVDWVSKSFTNNVDGTATYEFWYKEMVEKGTTKLEPLFTKITIPAQATNGDLAALAPANTPFTVDVKAEAIQADTFANAEEAWAAFGA